MWYSARNTAFGYDGEGFALTSVLRSNFKNVGPGAENIERGEFAIQDSVTNIDLDLAKPWETCFRPEQHVDMSMVFESKKGWNKCCPNLSSKTAIVPRRTKILSGLRPEPPAKSRRRKRTNPYDEEDEMALFRRVRIKLEVQTLLSAARSAPQELNMLDAQQIEQQGVPPEHAISFVVNPTINKMIESDDEMSESSSERWKNVEARRRDIQAKDTSARYWTVASGFKETLSFSNPGLTTPNLQEIEDTYADPELQRMLLEEQYRGSRFNDGLEDKEDTHMKIDTETEEAMYGTPEDYELDWDKGVDLDLSAEHVRVLRDNNDSSLRHQ
ncbi:hypothetical protein DL98DRAFT_530181 [Cadophora sp. DSE1049]|nr:hypothetical protein DL98DRAFT_530181 [Cadophora sp. DSE1049]